MQLGTPAQPHPTLRYVVIIGFILNHRLGASTTVRMRAERLVIPERRSAADSHTSLTGVGVERASPTDHSAAGIHGLRNPAGQRRAPSVVAGRSTRGRGPSAPWFNSRCASSRMRIPRP